MDPSLVISYALAGCGLALTLYMAWTLHSLNINRQYANLTLLKLFAAGNTERARKLCLAAPGSFFDAVGAAIVAAGKVESRDPVMLGAAIEPAFEAAARVVAARWAALVERGLIGVILTGGGLALALSSDHVPRVLMILGGLSVLAGLWLALRRRDLAVALATVRADVLPALVKAMINGSEAKDPEPVKPVPVKLERVEPEQTVPPAREPRPAAPPSLRDRRCLMCDDKKITRVNNREDDRFYRLVCLGCGYAQEYADLTKLDA